MNPKTRAARTTLTALIAAAAAGGTSAPAATATGGPQLRTFRVETQGIQTTTCQNCPVIGDAFPHLLDAVGDEQIVARIPASDLFDPSLRKHIVIGHGRVRRPSSDSSSTTSIHWTVSLTATR